MTIPNAWDSSARRLPHAPVFARNRVLSEILEENNIPNRFLARKTNSGFPTSSLDSVPTLDNPERLRGPNLAWFAWTSSHIARSRLDRLGGQATSEDGAAFVRDRGVDAKGPSIGLSEFIGSEKLAGYDSVRAVPFEKFGIRSFTSGSRSATPKFSFRRRWASTYPSSPARHITVRSLANVRNVVYSPRYPLIWAIDFQLHPHCSVLAQSNGTTVHVNR